MTSTPPAKPTTQVLANDFTCLHFGLPRCGSKSLQWYLLAEHPELFYLGIHDGNPRFKHTREFRYHRDATAQELLNQIFWNRTSSPDLALCRDLFRTLQGQARSKSRKPTLSLESFSTDTREVRRARAEHVWRIMGSNVRILFVLRSPVHLIESVYGLVWRRNNIAMPNGKFWCQSIDQWFPEARHLEAAAFLDYVHTIRLYEEIFDRSSIKILLFEDFLSDPSKFSDAVCEHFQIRSETSGLAGAPPTNSSPRAWQYGLLNGLNRAPGLAYALSQMKSRTRGWLFGAQTIGRPGRTRISSAHAQEIQRATAEGNRWLQEERGLSLEGKGYAL